MTTCVPRVHARFFQSNPPLLAGASVVVVTAVVAIAVEDSEDVLVVVSSAGVGAGVEGFGIVRWWIVVMRSDRQRSR